MESKCKDCINRGNYSTITNEDIRYQFCKIDKIAPPVIQDEQKNFVLDVKECSEYEQVGSIEDKIKRLKSNLETLQKEKK